MSQQAKQNLGAGDLAKGDSKRKMTSAIIEEQEDKQKKEVYDFLEDDDDFEEFEIAGELAEDAAAADGMIVDSIGDGTAEKKLWQEDWDDEEVDEDFARQLRAQLKK
jgi:26 proteasome complex subunit DSS1